MKVYIVMCGEYSDKYPESAYLDEEKAEVAAYLKGGYIETLETNDDGLVYSKDDIMYVYEVFAAASGLIRIKPHGVMLKGKKIPQKYMSENYVITKEKDELKVLEVYAESILRRVRKENKDE